MAQWLILVRLCFPILWRRQALSHFAQMVEVAWWHIQPMQGDYPLLHNNTHHHFSNKGVQSICWSPRSPHLNPLISTAATILIAHCLMLQNHCLQLRIPYCLPNFIMLQISNTGYKRCVCQRKTTRCNSLLSLWIMFIELILGIITFFLHTPKAEPTSLLPATLKNKVAIQDKDQHKPRITSSATCISLYWYN